MVRIEHTNIDRVFNFLNRHQGKKYASTEIAKVLALTTPQVVDALKELFYRKKLVQRRWLGKSKHIRGARYEYWV